MASSVRSLIHEHGVTALVALNDIYARDHLLHLGKAGIAVPRDISLISFDNSHIAHSFGLTSVDNDMGYLGHQAAGVLLGKITPPGGKRHTLWSRPWLVRRDTVRHVGDGSTDDPRVVQRCPDGIVVE